MSSRPTKTLSKPNSAKIVLPPPRDTDKDKSPPPPPRITNSNANSSHAANLTSPIANKAVALDSESQRASALLGEWNCPDCCFVNTRGRRTCESCGEERPRSGSSLLVPETPPANVGVGNSVQDKSGSKSLSLKSPNNPPASDEFSQFAQKPSPLFQHSKDSAPSASASHSQIPIGFVSPSPKSGGVAQDGAGNAQPAVTSGGAVSRAKTDQSEKPGAAQSGTGNAHARTDHKPASSKDSHSRSPQRKLKSKEKNVDEDLEHVLGPSSVSVSRVNKAPDPKSPSPSPVVPFGKQEVRESDADEESESTSGTEEETPFGMFYEYFLCCNA